MSARPRRPRQKNDEAIGRALVAKAITDPSSRAMTMLLERRLGKVPDRLELATATKDPFDMSEEELVAWLSTTEEPATED